MTRSQQAPKASVVRYDGGADVRSLSAADFKRNGVEGQKAATWDNENGKELPASDFTDEALTFLADIGFTVVTA